MDDDSITVWRDGRFATERRPDWWNERVGEIFPGYPVQWAEDEKLPVISRYGNDVTRIKAWELGAQGFLVIFDEVGFSTEVWAPTRADYLDLITTRAVAWVGLGESRPLAESMEHIRNAIIAFARYGHGDHVSESDGVSSIDRRAEYEREKARLAKLDARKRPQT